MEAAGLKPLMIEQFPRDIARNKFQSEYEGRPKVMYPIYFHGNYNRYKEHNNTI